MRSGMAEISIAELTRLTYPQLRLKDNTLDDNLPAKQYFLNPDSFTAASASVGALDVLPLELLEDVLSQLDLYTLVNFRCVNRRATELVHYLPSFKAIIAHAQDVLRGMLYIGTARWTTCRSLYEKLCTAECEDCGDFGGYVYIIICKRVCFLCLSSRRAYLPLLVRHACQLFGLDQKTVKSLPSMKVFPGTYSPNEKKAGRSILIDYNSALSAGVTRHGSPEAMQQYVSAKQTQELRDYHAKRAALQPGSRCTMRQPRATDPFDGHSGNSLRFVAIVRMPWLNRTSKDTEWGFHCVGCKKFSRDPLHWRRRYDVTSFRDHLRVQGAIQKGKHHPE